MSDSEIAELCQQIYRKHRRALDLIFEHRPDRQEEIREFLLTVISVEEGLIFEGSPRKEHIQFGVAKWDVPFVLSADRWTDSNRILLFQFENTPHSLHLGLLLGPGPETVRRLIVERARQQSPPLRMPTRVTKWTCLFERTFLTNEQLEEMSHSEVESRIRERWQQFVRDDLPRIIDAMDIEGLASETQSSLSEL